eukprot:1322422-Pleurochrysis_carterae.AAC.1
MYVEETVALSTFATGGTYRAYAWQRASLLHGRLMRRVCKAGNELRCEEAPGNSKLCRFRRALDIQSSSNEVCGRHLAHQRSGTHKGFPLNLQRIASATSCGNVHLTGSAAGSKGCTALQHMRSQRGMRRQMPVLPVLYMAQCRSIRGRASACTCVCVYMCACEYALDRANAYTCV